MKRRGFKIAMIPLACMAMSGCALLGGGKPAQLFRFGGADPVAATSASAIGGATRFVAFSPPQFAPEIEGDRMLASQGAQAFYIKGARWIAPAPVLFERAVQGAFRDRAASIVLANRQSGVRADQSLQVSVEKFEASYDTLDAPPTIVLEAQVSILNSQTREISARYRISESRLATSNEINAIVAAFDAVVDKAATGIAEWTGRVPPAAAPPN